MGKLSLFVVLLLSPSMLTAHELQIEQCAVEGVMDRKCLKNLVRQLNKEVDALYSNALGSLQSDIKSSEKSEAKNKNASSYKKWLINRLHYLQQSQTAYLNYRKILCDAEYQRYEGGSLASSAAMACMVENAVLRKNWLNRVYLQD